MSDVTTVLVIVLGWIGLSIPVSIAVGAFFRRCRPIALRVAANGSLEQLPLR